MSQLEQENLKKVTAKAAAIRNIINPSEAVQLAAVRQNCWLIMHIETPSEEVQLVAVQENGYVLQGLKSPSAAVQLMAVRQVGDAIKYIRAPNEEIQLAAVQQSPWALQFIKHPTYTAQLTAVLADFFALAVCRESFTPTQADFVKVLSGSLTTDQAHEDVNRSAYTSTPDIECSGSLVIDTVAERCSDLLFGWSDEQAAAAFSMMPPVLQQRPAFVPLLRQILQNGAERTRQDDPALPRKPNAL